MDCRESLETIMSLFSSAQQLEIRSRISVFIHNSNAHILTTVSKRERSRSWLIFPALKWSDSVNLDTSSLQNAFLKWSHCIHMHASSLHIKHPLICSTHAEVKQSCGCTLESHSQVQTEQLRESVFTDFTRTQDQLYL